MPNITMSAPKKKTPKRGRDEYESMLVILDENPNLKATILSKIKIMRAMSATDTSKSLKKKSEKK